NNFPSSAVSMPPQCQLGGQFTILTAISSQSPPAECFPALFSRIFVNNSLAEKGPCPNSLAASRATLKRVNLSISHILSLREQSKLLGWGAERERGGARCWEE